PEAPSAHERSTSAMSLFPSSDGYQPQCSPFPCPLSRKCGRRRLASGRYFPLRDERPRQVRLPREKLVENARKERAWPWAARDHGQDRDLATDLDRGVN